jgi:hypothetical protein
MTMKKVQPGDKLRIPAATFNTMIDAADDFLRRRNSVTRKRPPQADTGPHSVLVRNDTGEDCPRFGILEPWTGLVFTPEDDPGLFLHTWAFKGRKPSDWQAGAAQFLLITIEPIAAGKVGHAVIDGITPVRLDLTDTSHEFAVPLHNDTGKLQSTWPNPAAIPIIWREDPYTTGEQWAIVNLGRRFQPTCLNGKAQSNWHKTGDDYPYVDVGQCKLGGDWHYGGGAGSYWNPMRVYFPPRYMRDPNVIGGQVVQFAIDESGLAMAHSGYDHAIGTVLPFEAPPSGAVDGWRRLNDDYGAIRGATLSLLDNSVFPDYPGLAEWGNQEVASGTGAYIPRYGVEFWVREDNSYEHYHGA